MDNAVDENGKLKLKSKKLIEMLGGVSEFDTSKGITHDFYFNGKTGSAERIDFESLSSEELEEFSKDMINITKKLKFDKVLISGIKWPKGRENVENIGLAMEKLIMSTNDSVILTDMEMPKTISYLLSGRNKPLEYLNIQMDSNEDFSRFARILNPSVATKMSIEKDMGSTYLGINNMEHGIWRASIGAKENYSVEEVNKFGQKTTKDFPVEISSTEMDSIASDLLNLQNQNNCPKKITVTGIKTNSKNFSSVLEYLSNQNKKVETIGCEILEPVIENKQSNPEIVEPVIKDKQSNPEIVEPVIENKQSNPETVEPVEEWKLSSIIKNRLKEEIDAVKTGIKERGVIGQLQFEWGLMKKDFAEIAKKIPILKGLFKKEVPKLEASKEEKDSKQQTSNWKQSLQAVEEKTHIQNPRESSMEKDKSEEER